MLARVRFVGVNGAAQRISHERSMPRKKPAYARRSTKTLDRRAPQWRLHSAAAALSGRPYMTV